MRIVDLDHGDDGILRGDRRLDGGEQEVQFWREPLSEMCAAATDAGFVIRKVIEPRPAESMREA